MSTMEAMRITEDWLRDCGFKWEQHERQPAKHWVLWIGVAWSRRLACAFVPPR